MIFEYILYFGCSAANSRACSSGPAPARAEGEYLLDATAPVNGRPVWRRQGAGGGGGGYVLYWTPAFGKSGGPAWVLDTDTDPGYAEIFLISPADAPPTGAAAWLELCDGFNPNKMGSPLPGKQAGLPVGAVIAEAVGVTGWYVKIAFVHVGLQMREGTKNLHVATKRSCPVQSK